MSEAVAYNPAVVAEKRSRVRLWILAMILFLSTVAYADRSILSISGSGIKDEFGLSPVQLGFILSAFSWAYVLGQIPGGLILDRFGTKTVYGVTLVLWSVSTFLMGLSASLRPRSRPRSPSSLGFASPSASSKDRASRPTPVSP